MSMRRVFRKAASAGLVVLVGAVGLGLVGIRSASATTGAGSTPAGRYTSTLLAPKSPPFRDPLTLTAKRFSFDGGPKGTWTEHKDVITMTSKGALSGFVFTIHQSGKNLGSNAHPGSVTFDGKHFARWYAKRK